MFTKNYYRILEQYNYLAGSSLSYSNLIDMNGNTGNNINIFSSGSSSRYLGGISLGMDNNAYLGFKSGSLYYLSNGTTLYYGSQSNSSGANNGVMLGDGDTQPTINDYNLSGSQITDFTATTACSIIETDDKLKFVGTYNITNTGASNLNIKEYALRLSGGSTYYAIFNRGIFATPVVIEPGQTGIVTIEIAFQN